MLIIEETCDNYCVKEKKIDVSKSLWKDISRSRNFKWTDGNDRCNKGVRTIKDIDCSVSQHNVYVEGFKPNSLFSI